MHRSGQLAAANSDFIGLTLETRPDAELASRAASFLRMAKKHEMPLIALRESEEGRRAISETMTREKVRSDGRQMDIVSLTHHWVYEHHHHHSLQSKHHHARCDL